MTKKGQLKINNPTNTKRNHSVPFGLIVTPFFTSQTLARLKIQKKKNIDSCTTHSHVVPLTRSFT